MPFYLVPCECGNSVKVDSALAGGTTTCDQCQATVEIPSLRLLKDLPQAEAAEKDALQPVGVKESNPTRNLGAILILLSLLSLAVLGYARYTSVTGITADDAIEWGNQQIDSLTPEESWKMWQEVQELGMGPREVTLTQIEERRVLAIYLLMGVAVVVALVGVGLIASSGKK